VFIPKNAVYEAASAVAARHEDLSVHWLNNAVKGLVPPGLDPGQTVVYGGPSLTVAVASPQHLLARKVRAARLERDGEDIRLLAQVLGLTTAAAVLDVAQQVWGAVPLEPTSPFIVDELMG